MDTFAKGPQASPKRGRRAALSRTSGEVRGALAQPAEGSTAVPANCLLAEDIPLPNAGGTLPGEGFPRARVLDSWLEGGYVILDQDYRIVAANTLFCHWVGSDEAELVGQPFSEVAGRKIPAWNDGWEAFLRDSAVFGKCPVSVVEAGIHQCYEFEWARHAGGCSVRLHSILPPQKELAESAWDEYMGNETARRNMFIRLLRAEAQLENLIHRWPGVIFSQRTDFTFLFVSPQIERFTGITIQDWETQPNRFWQLVHEADQGELRQQIKRSIHTPAGVTSTYRIRHAKSGQVSYLMEHRQATLSRNGLLLGYEGVWLDVTRQTIAEKRLSTAAWKETLGVLTMGLAHDFSNIMAGIHSLSESFLTQIDAHHPFQEGLSLIKKQSMQASQLVHRIIQLHHGKPGDRNYHNLNELLADLVGLARKMIPRRIEVLTEYAAEPLALYADAFEFQQVLFNLTINATDAMPHSGKITYRTSRHAEFPSLAYVQGTMPRLPAVCLEVQDTGCGIPARSLGAIFDPFYTTKAMNKGSGLGLYNARLFVEKHHGAISVTSTEGVGTAFCIWLPEADFSESERKEIAGGGQRRSLLVVGPPGELLNNTTEFLRLNGYHVVNASNADQVSCTLQSGEYRIVGLFLLAETSELDWLSICAQARRLNSSLKVILQAIGCNQDDLETRVLEQADYVITNGMPQEDVVARLRRIFGESE
jgi:PAS domain S-box-containing protein